MGTIEKLMSNYDDSSIIKERTDVYEDNINRDFKLLGVEEKTELIKRFINGETIYTHVKSGPITFPLPTKEDILIHVFFEVLKFVNGGPIGLCMYTMCLDSVGGTWSGYQKKEKQYEMLSKDIVQEILNIADPIIQSEYSDLPNDIEREELIQFFLENGLCEDDMMKNRQPKEYRIYK